MKIVFVWPSNALSNFYPHRFKLDGVYMVDEEDDEVWIARLSDSLLKRYERVQDR